MLKLTKTSDIDCEKYLEDLKYLGFIYVDRSVLERRIDLMEPYRDTVKHLCIECMLSRSGHKFYSLDSKMIVAYLKHFENCPDYIFKKKGSDNESLDAKKVIAPLIEKGFAVEFLELYREYKSTKYLIEKLHAMVGRLAESDMESYDGKKLYKMRFRYKNISNLRLSTSEENVQGIPKKILDSFVAPRGYTIVSGDFEQADLRWAYSLMVKTKENLPIMMKYDDKYEGFARILEGEEFDLENFKENRSAYKVSSLAPIYGATSATTMAGTKFIQRARAELKRAPHYQEFLRRIKRRVDLKLPLKITSYFGDSEIVNTTDPVGYDGKDPVNFALNSPIQKGTSEIVKAVSNGIMEEFAELGYTSENGSIYSYLNRHDEALFLIKNELLEHSYIFQKHQIVQVDNFIPFEIGFDFSKTYTVEDKDVMSTARNYFKPEYTIMPEIDYDNEDYYIPTKDLLEVCIGTHFIAETNETVIAFYDEGRQRCSFEVVKDATPDKLIDSVLWRASVSGPRLKELDSDCILFYTTLVPQDTTVFKKFAIRLTPNYSSSLCLKANTVAEFGAFNLLRSRNVESTPSNLVTDSKEFLNQLVRNGQVF